VGKLHDDLLEQARHLASREPKKPRQASLRRAVSAAYYAMLHLLASAGSEALAPHRPVGLRPQIRRAFAHAEMKVVCKQFARGSVDNLTPGTAHLVTAPIEPELKNVADTFVELQEARHNADYDLTNPFDRIDVLQKIALVEKAFDDWKVVCDRHNSVAFLAALLLQRQWNRSTAERSG
jgi:hypothetical protein